MFVNTVELSQITRTMSILSRLPALAWYWTRLQCMSVGEVAHRVHQRAMTRIQKFGLATACDVMPAELSRVARSFVGKDSRFAQDPYIRAAAGILAGELKIFSLDCHFGLTPD